MKTMKRSNCLMLLVAFFLLLATNAAMADLIGPRRGPRRPWSPPLHHPHKRVFPDKPNPFKPNKQTPDGPKMPRPEAPKPDEDDLLDVLRRLSVLDDELKRTRRRSQWMDRLIMLRQCLLRKIRNRLGIKTRLVKR